MILTWHQAAEVLDSFDNSKSQGLDICNDSIKTGGGWKPGPCITSNIYIYICYKSILDWRYWTQIWFLMTSWKTPHILRGCRLSIQLGNSFYSKVKLHGRSNQIHHLSNFFNTLPTLPSKNWPNSEVLIGTTETTYLKHLEIIGKMQTVELRSRLNSNCHPAVVHVKGLIEKLLLVEQRAVPKHLCIDWQMIG